MTEKDSGLLGRVAEQAMLQRGFLLTPPAEAQAEAQAQQPASDAQGARDLTGLPWSSIDNVESRDLDQIEAAEAVAGGVRLLVGIADVERYVPALGANDRFSGHNTTTVYTGVRTFPMLPERLAFDVSSLQEGQRRFAVVLETLVTASGEVTRGNVFPALVMNRAKLDYPSVSSWLDGKGPVPPGLEDPILKAQVELQASTAKALREGRRRAGALDLETAKPRLEIDERGAVKDVAAGGQDTAGNLIEELMIASNRAAAQALDALGVPSIRRVVKEPERWAKIAAYAALRGVTLPAAPDPVQLSRFVAAMRQGRPQEFPEICLALIKLIGKGEYAPHRPGAVEVGHFGLATAQYAHATAPNRRYPDIITQRLLKKTRAYAFEELAEVAERATRLQSEARKVERQVQKSAAALLLRGRVGETFSGLVTGAADKGTYARLFAPHVEGRIIQGEKGLYVGDQVRLKLCRVDVEKGFIDFEVS